MTFTEPSKKFAAEFFKLIFKSKSIVVTSHSSPDDDSIGSILSIYWIVKQKYSHNKVAMIYTGEHDSRYQKFAGYDKINFVPDLADNLSGVDLLIMLDGGSFGRFSNKPEELKKFTGKTICIDHHSSPSDKFDLFLLCPQLPASCQIIYESFCQSENISKPVAEALFLGLLGDTNNFQYLRPSDIGAFEMGQKLIEILGVQIQEFKSRYDILSQRIFQIIKELVINTRFEKMSNWDGYSWTYLSRETAERESLIQKTK